MLNGKMFYTLNEAHVVIENWRRHYNRVRPHSAIGYRSPASEIVISMLPLSAVGGLQAATC